MISIQFFKQKFIIYLSFFAIGVIIILVSLIQINKAYAKIAKIEQHEDYFVGNAIPFYWMIMLIGGIIIITLSYVSWRKYKGEKKNSQKRDTIN